MTQSGGTAPSPVQTMLEAEPLPDRDTALTVPASLPFNVFIAQRRERWEPGLGDWAS